MSMVRLPNAAVSGVHNPYIHNTRKWVSLLVNTGFGRVYYLPGIPAAPNFGNTPLCVCLTTKKCFFSGQASRHNGRRFVTAGYWLVADVMPGK
jgi:hypothetical protein